MNKKLYFNNSIIRNNFLKPAINRTMKIFTMNGTF